jgi:two-component system sensor histidine kinase YesM
LELSKQEIQRELKEFISFKDERAILFGSDFIWSVTDSMDADLTTQLKDIVAAQVKKEDPAVTRMAEFDYNGKPYILTLEHSAAFNITLLMYMPEESALGPLKTYSIWFWILSILSLVIVVFFSFWIYRVIHRPLKQLVVTFRKVEKGNLKVRLKPTSNDEFEYLYLQFNSMLSQLGILIKEVYEEKIRSQKSELKQLQAQINPHFLYNTFFILNRMVKVEDYPKLRPFTKHLGNYFKFITRNGSDEVQLREEFEFAKSYLEIQKIRFEDRIQVEIEPLPEAFADTLVPRLTLQPIIENSFKYGVESVVSGGLLHISFDRRDDRLVIEIEVNG